MNATYQSIDWTEAFAAYPSWPLRLDAFRGSALEAACVESIRDDAQRAEQLDWYWAAQAYLDTGELTELDELMAAEAEAEREQGQAYAYELRTGRCFDDDKLAGVV